MKELSKRLATSNWYKALWVASDMVSAVVFSAIAIAGPGDMPVWVRVLAGASALLTFVSLLGGLSAQVVEDVEVEVVIEDPRVKRWDEQG